MMLFLLNDLFLISDGYKVIHIISINHWSFKISFSDNLCHEVDRYVKTRFSVINFFFLFLRGFGDLYTFGAEL